MDKINYEEIYDHCKAICPEMQSVIEYVRNISSSNKEIKNTVDRLKGGDMPTVKRYIELYMKKGADVFIGSGKAERTAFGRAVFRSRVCGSTASRRFSGT